VQDYIRKVLPELPKNHIEALITLTRSIYVSKYKKPRTPKYGNLNKGFTEQQIQAFFKVIDNQKFKLLFQYQALLALRIGEAVKLNMSDIDLDARELKLVTEKARSLDSLRIPIQLFKDTVAYIRKNQEQIEKHKGYLFYPEPLRSSRGDLYLDLDYARNVFRKYVVEAGIDEIYDVSELGRARSVRDLHLLTTHSLRHYAITRMAKLTNGNLILTSRFARHAQPNTTMIYISTDKRELFEAIDDMSMDDIKKFKKRFLK
jgi:integrase